MTISTSNGESLSAFVGEPVKENGTFRTFEPKPQLQTDAEYAQPSTPLKIYALVKFSLLVSTAD